MPRMLPDIPAGTILVLAWYRREDFDRIRALAPDGGGLQDTFDDWQKEAQETVARYIAKGVAPKRIIVDPDDFAAFLKAGNLQSNEKTRAHFVWEIEAARHSTKQ